jgi:hypothetical protein
VALSLLPHSLYSHLILELPGTLLLHWLIRLYDFVVCMEITDTYLNHIMVVRIRARFFLILKLCACYVVKTSVKLEIGYNGRPVLGVAAPAASPSCTWLIIQQISSFLENTRVHHSNYAHHRQVMNH